MLQLFTPDYKDILEKLNSYYYESMSTAAKEIDENEVFYNNNENQNEDNYEDDDISLEGDENYDFYFK